MGHRPGRLSRFCGRYQPSGKAVMPRDTATCFTCIKDCRRESLSNTHDDLPRPPLHHGRTMGNYDLMSNIPGIVRHRRSQFLRPWRQPSRRKCTHAGTRRWVLRIPYTLGILSRGDSGGRACPTGTPGVQGRNPNSREKNKEAPLHKRCKNGEWNFTGSWARPCGNTAVWPEMKPACSRQSHVFQETAG